MKSPDHQTDPAQAQYRRPDWFSRTVLNPVLTGLMRLGISVRGSRVLEHRGRRTGKTYRTPVNLLRLDGADYLVAARGETEWVRNVRAAGGQLDLILGRHRQTLTATEITAPDCIPVLRAYLRRWKFEVGMFFDGVGPDSTDAEFAAIAPRHPVFLLG